MLNDDRSAGSAVIINTTSRASKYFKTAFLALGIVGICLLSVIAINSHRAVSDSSLRVMEVSNIDSFSGSGYNPEEELLKLAQSMGKDEDPSLQETSSDKPYVPLNSPEHLLSVPKLVDYELVSAQLSESMGLFPIWKLPGDSGSSGLFMEIPVDLLEVPFLVTAVYSKADSSFSLYHFQAEQTEQVVFYFQISKDGMGIDVVAPDYTLRASDSQMKNAEKNGASEGFITTLQPVSLRTRFNNDTNSNHVEAIVIDAWEMFVQYGGFVFPSQQVAEYFGAWPQVLKANSFPENVMIEMQFPIFAIQFSMSLLPEVPMSPRVADDRIGFFSVSYTDLGLHKTETTTQIDPTITLISKWRLEKIPGSSQVVKPITYYLDPSIPEMWRPFVKAGVEKWNLAFSRIGYEGAVRAVSPGDKDFPEDFNAGDIRYNAISWAVDLDSVFAVGFSTNDPRTGEILKANIIVTHGWINSWTSRINAFESARGLSSMNTHGFLQHAKDISDFSLNPSQSQGSESLHLRDCQHRRSSHHFMDSQLFETFYSAKSSSKSRSSSSKGIPLDIIGEGLTDVIMHEVGHTLGLRHNFKASTHLTWEQLKDQKLTSEEGLTASVMDYLPIHVRADLSEDIDHFTTTLGKYDYWAIEYGYIPIADERPGIQHHRLAQIASTMNEDGKVFATDEDDPSVNGEDPLNNLFDLAENPLDFAADRIALVRNVRSHLVDSVAPGDSWVGLASSELALLGQVYRSMGIAAKFLGGYDISKAHKGDENSPFSSISLIDIEKQQQAVNLVCSILSDDDLFLSPEVFMKLVDRQGFECQGLFSACNGLKSIDALELRKMVRVELIEMLLDPARLSRMQHTAWVAKSKNLPYIKVSEVFGNITQCSWGSDIDSLSEREDRWSLAGWWVDRLMMMTEDLTSPVNLAAHSELVQMVKILGGSASESVFTRGVRQKIMSFAGPVNEAPGNAQ